MTHFILWNRTTPFFFEVKYKEGPPQHLFPQILDKNKIIKNILVPYASGYNWDQIYPPTINT